MHGETSAIRFSEAQKLLDYGFSNFEYKEFSKKGDILKSINVDKGVLSSVEVVFEDDSGFLIKKGESKDITTKVNIPDVISAPIEKGQKLGEVSYLVNDEIIASTNLIAKENVKKLSFGNMCERITVGWFTLLRK